MMYINITSHSQRKGQGCPWLSCNWSWRWPCVRWHPSVGAQKQSVMSLWLGLGLARTLELLCLHPCCILRDRLVPPVHITDGETEPYSQAVMCPRSPSNTTAQEEVVPAHYHPASHPLPYTLQVLTATDMEGGGEEVCLSLTGIQWPKGALIYKYFLILDDFKNNICSYVQIKNKKNPNHPWKTERNKIICNSQHGKNSNSL